MSDVRALVYELALRALEQQERELSELRARTNTIIAAAALIASFLGAAVIRKPDGLTAWSVIALAMLVLNGALSLVVLWPRRLGFAIDARETYLQVHAEDLGEARLRIAYSARDRYEFNKRRIDRLESAFGAAVVTLGLQTLLWTLALAVR